MYGLGRKRSKFGMYCESKGISQQDIVRVSDLNKETVSKAFVEDNPKLRGITKKALAGAASKLTGKRVYADDFWT